MHEEEREFFEILNSFRKLNISSMLPDISQGDYGTLRAIQCCEKKNDTDGVKVSEVSKRMNAAPPAVSRCLRSLEEKDFIIRAVDKSDRRNTYVALTEEGRNRLSEADEIMSKFSKAVFGQMGEETMNLLNSYLKELRETAKSEISVRKYQKREEETENE